MTAAVWLPGVDRIPGEGSGPWAPGPDAPKIVWHSTEGNTIGSAVAAFTANRSWPHVTADAGRRRIVQHVPLDQAARALRNTSAPGETNRAPRTFQIELVGHAATMADMPAADLEWLGVHLVAPLAQLTGTPPRSRVPIFHQYPPENGHRLGREPWRLTADAYATYTGHLSHAEVPENSHGDPGPLNIAAILAASLPQEDPDMFTDQDHELIVAIAKALGVNDPKGPLPQRIRDTVAKIDTRTRELVKLARPPKGRG